VYANDIDPNKRSLYEAHFGRSEHFHLEDIAKTNAVAARIPEKAFLATASFPCVDLSLAGNRRGLQGKHSSTFFGFTKVLESLGGRRPPLVMLENVTGFITSNKGQDFAKAARALADLGYCIDAFVLDANHFVPQSRRRVFLIAISTDLEVPGAVRQSTSSSIACPWINRLDATKHVRPTNLAYLMKTVDLPTGWTALALSPLPPLCKNVADFIDIDEKQDWWDQTEVHRHYRMMSDRHRCRVDALQATGRPEVGTVYRRVRYGSQKAEVRLDGVAGCLRTPRGGSAKQIVIVIEPERLRMRWMSPREYARLQGVDDHPLGDNVIKQLYGFGDAVCVPVIRWIDRHVLTPAFEAARLR
jgi:DNA (cytosine-5)-methyltransferase 1